jgi:hypothetical protein
MVDVLYTNKIVMVLSEMDWPKMTISCCKFEQSWYNTEQNPVAMIADEVISLTNINGYHTSRFIICTNRKSTLEFMRKAIR